MNDVQAASHSALTHLTYDENVLLWGGRRVTDIVAEMGHSPLYIYDRNQISQRVTELRNAIPETLHVHYAIKANPMQEVVEHLSRLVDGLDVASQRELEIALETNTNPQDISFAGPGKRTPEIEAAVSAGITINVESEKELSRINEVSNSTGKVANVAIRVNPSFELKSAGMKMTGKPSQFGIDDDRVPTMIKNIESMGLNFRGLHVFSGSQNLRPESIAETLARTVDLVLSISETTSLAFPTINLGGGLGIPYFPGEDSLDLSLLSAAYETAAEKLTRSLGNPELIIELGRYLVGESGIYVCKVIDVKESRGKKFAICDGGLHHHLAVTGNFGQILRKNYPVVNVDHSGDKTEVVTIVGPLCTPLDILGDQISLHRLQEGSMIAILQSGAYGFTASPDRFLSHPAAKEILV